MGLDKFYTNSNVAKACYDFLIKHFPNIENELFLEPSAGSGVFLQYLRNYIALDIQPEGENIIEQDFLTYTPSLENLITIGNPPFGHRSSLAVQFFNKAAIFSDIIAFIVPVSFMKWNVQKELSNNFALVDYFYLEQDSFTSEGKPFGVRTVFQIWVKKGSKYDNKTDLRLLKQPPISHSDFEIWQYNATPGAMNTVEQDWTIATWRQGYHDYNQLFSHDDYEEIKKNMIGPPKKQYFFIKPKTEEAERIIRRMDFNSLAERNTSTPGFGKGDFVSYYMELKNQLNKNNIEK